MNGSKLYFSHSGAKEPTQIFAEALVEMQSKACGKLLLLALWISEARSSL